MRCCSLCHRVWQEAHDFCPADGTPLELVREDRDPLVGLILDDRYELLRLLGVGGMGFVYLAGQLGLGRRVAVKMLYAERTRDRTSVKRFQREAHALASLAHPGIVRVIDYGDLDGRNPYLVMEQVLGPPLDAVLRERGALPPRVAVEVATQLAEAVSAAHRGAVVHRDLKPANIHVALDATGRLQARILDFGLAQIVAKDDDEVSAQTRLTRKGVIFGTPEYMAPEQVRGLGASAATDLYALGVVLFEMLVGDPPFVASSAVRVLAQQAEKPAPPLPALPGVDEGLRQELERVVQGLLAKDPKDRPGSAEQVARALRRIAPRLPEPPDLAGVFGGDLPIGGPPGEDTLMLEEPAEDGDAFAGVVATRADADRALERALSDAGRGRWIRWVLVASVAAALLAAASPLVLAAVRGELGPSRRAPGFIETGPLLEVTSAPSGRATGAEQLPGGEDQARYEARLRAFQATLAGRGLRVDALRLLPPARNLWLLQSEAAAAYRFADAEQALVELEELAASVPVEQLLGLALRRARRTLGEAAAGELDRLEDRAPDAAQTARETRKLLDTLRGLEARARSADGVSR